jgi:outer membrane protein assembly factor BamB
MVESRCNWLGLWAGASAVLCSMCLGCGASEAGKNETGAPVNGAPINTGERPLAGAGAQSPADKPSGGAMAAALDPGAPVMGAPSSGTTPTAMPVAVEAVNEWHQMGYDERNHYHNPAETSLSVDNVAELELKWSFTVAGFPPGSPIIAEGKVFVLATGALYAIDLTSGEQVWARDDIAGTASVAYADGALYVHSGVAELYRVKASDGSTVWGPIKTNDAEAADGMSSPIVAGGKVFVGYSAEAAEIDLSGRLSAAQRAARGGLFAADAQTGAVAFRYNTVEPDAAENGAMIWSSVGVDVEAGTLIATTGNNWNTLGPNSDAFHMLDLATGAKLWVHQVRTTDLWTIANGTGTNRDTDFGANPIVLSWEGKRVVAAGDKASEFWALDAETGTPLWSRTELSSSHNEPNGGILNNGAFDGKYFYVVANQPGGGAPNTGLSGSLLHALDPSKQGADAWPALMFDKVTWGMPTVANGVLLVPIDDDLYVVNAHTGEMLNMFTTGGSIAAGGASIAQGRIVVASGLQYQIAGANLARNNNQVHCYGLPGDMPGMSTGSSGGNPAQPTGNPTWSAVFQEVIVGTGCNGQPACHASEAGGGLNLRTKDLAYSSLVGVAAMGMDQGAGTQQCVASGLQRVVAGDPDASLLLQKLEHTQTCGGPMPSASETLPAAQLQQVRSWIGNGAPND